MHAEAMDAFAAEAVAAEREACAKICDAAVGEYESALARTPGDGIELAIVCHVNACVRDELMAQSRRIRARGTK